MRVQCLYRARIWRALALVAVVCLVGSAARAGSITASTKFLIGPSNADPAASTFSVYAYSASKGQVNATTSTNYPDPTKAPNVYKSEFITVPLPGGKNQKVAPVVGFRDLEKPLVNPDNKYPTGIYTESVTDAAKGYGGVLNSKGVFTLLAEGNTKAGDPSIGAGTAIDPFAVDPGTYQYSYGLSFSMEVYPTDPFTSLSAGAGDLQHANLWNLSIVATAPIGSKSELQIEFTSDPSLGLNDTTVANDLRTAIGVTGGVASLTDYPLFYTTYYTLSPTIYSDNLTVATASVPEPRSLRLLLSGGLGLCVLVAGGRRARSPTARAP
ncbi:MAG: hypothetical protein K2Y37_14415 [Pirellulales bacterium]|nr:hypothetical protein [Pirellulales bacterium]